MSTKDKVLQALQNNEHYLSGQELADYLDISRNAVWKAIKTLQQEGYIIESKSHKGYQLQQVPSTLNEALLKQYFTDGDVFVYSSTHSTNTQAKLYADTLTKPYALFVSSEQTNGKGRFNRQFHSPKNTGIYMSLLYKAHDLTEHLQLVTPLAAVAVCRAIKDICQVDVSIKWVNDLFFKKKKIAGILAETVMNIELNKIDYIVIGIGINVYEDKTLPDELHHIVGYLTDKPVNMNALVHAMTKELLYLLGNLPNNDFMSEYRQHCFILGKQITVYHPSETYKAKAIDILDTGELVVQTDTGQTKTLHFGEVSTKI